MREHIKVRLVDVIAGLLFITIGSYILRYFFSIYSAFQIGEAIAVTTFVTAFLRDREVRKAEAEKKAESAREDRFREIEQRSILLENQIEQAENRTKLISETLDLHTQSYCHPQAERAIRDLQEDVIANRGRIQYANAQVQYAIEQKQTEHRLDEIERSIREIIKER